MSKHILFVCKSCHCSEEELAEGQLSDGTRLLEQLQLLSHDQFAPSELEIQPVGCMWACHHGCVAAITSPDKPTYLITKLPPDDTAAALLEAIQLYMQHRKGAISWEKVPESIKPTVFARIPSMQSPHLED
ncbi:DUF1636 domain-containing protein [Leptolyngbya sp. AN03gr2]|uniref:DUF1636 domain-containing protein n=1 Tax=unclassified Leptolyngbya TaxID=2650499 RepID=UPI003D322154